VQGVLDEVLDDRHEPVGAVQGDAPPARRVTDETLGRGAVGLAGHGTRTRAQDQRTGQAPPTGGPLLGGRGPAVPGDLRRGYGPAGGV